MTIPLFILAPLLCMVLCAAYTDARTRRIPNWLTGTGLLLALSIHGAAEGWPGLRLALGGMAAALAIYLPLYLLRALGAGDVKLMAAVGAFAGASLWLRIFAATALLGAVAALVLALSKGRLRSTLWTTGFIANELLHLRAPYLANRRLDVKQPGALTLPHGLAIACGVLISLLLA